MVASPGSPPESSSSRARLVVTTIVPLVETVREPAVLSLLSLVEVTGGVRCPAASRPTRGRVVCSRTRPATYALEGAVAPCSGVVNGLGDLLDEQVKDESHTPLNLLLEA